MIFGSVPIDLRFGSCGSFSFAGSMTPRFVPVRVCRFVSVRGHTGWATNHRVAIKKFQHVFEVLTSGWWWLEPWNFMTFPSYWECHHPNWRPYNIFPRGRLKPPTRLQCGGVLIFWPPKTWVIYICIRIYIYIVTQAQFSMARKNPALHRALTTEVLGVDLMSRCRWLGRVITPKWCVYIYIYMYIYMYVYVDVYVYVRVYYTSLHYITLLY